MSKKLIYLSIILLSQLSIAAPTKVGNGDAGGDLEKMERVTSGVLVSTRDKAVALLEKQNISNMPGLSKLIPELKRAEMYLAQSNVSPVLNTDNQDEISADGRYVYARTFAEPLAPVRFFPAAMLLSEEQLVNLHIHEALHRALPSSVNQDESVVSELTLALTSPDASYDRTKAIVDRYLSGSTRAKDSAGSQVYYKNPEPPQTERLKNPSVFGYTYTAYSLSEDDETLLPVQGVHQINSLLYPFGEDSSVRGLGLKFSLIDLEKKSLMGPIGVSLNMLLATWRGFDVESFVEGSLYVLSEEELKNLPKVRDTITAGISMKKDGEEFYTENFLSVTAGGTKNFRVGNTKYTESFSPILDARFEFGKKSGAWTYGVFGDFLLTEGSEVTSANNTFENDRERNRAFKFGPKIGYRMNNLDIQLRAQKLIDKTPGYSMTDFGSLMGVGAGSSSISGSLIFNY